MTKYNDNFFIYFFVQIEILSVSDLNPHMSLLRNECLKNLKTLLQNVIYRVDLHLISKEKLKNKAVDLRFTLLTFSNFLVKNFSRKFIKL